MRVPSACAGCQRPDGCAEATQQPPSRAGQALLLLKSSDKVAADLAPPRAPGAAGVRHCLVLRKYRTLNAALEFRCFVVDGLVAGISQRRCARGPSPG